MPQQNRKFGLARALSKLGFCSRSQATVLIRAGRVRLNGAVRHDPETPTHVDRDRIVIDGYEVEARRSLYLMMNKPRGLVTTASDEKGRDTVYDILKPEEFLPWIAPVGRLDKASEGLLLLTNDSEWGARVAAPETHLHKIYHVQIGCVADEKMIGSLKKGVRLEDGDFLRVNQCRRLRSGEKNSWLEITLEEGKNRHIRRMLTVLDVSVLRLIRVAIGPLELGRMGKGTYRPLTVEEKTALDNAMEQTSGQKRSR